MKEKRKRFTEKQLVSFGNYLLSEERNKSVESHPELKASVDERKMHVSDADVENWKNTLNK